MYALDLPIGRAVIFGDGRREGGAELVDGQESDEMSEKGMLGVLWNGRHRR